MQHISNPQTRKSEANVVMATRQARTLSALRAFDLPRLELFFRVSGPDSNTGDFILPSCFISLPLPSCACAAGAASVSLIFEIGSLSQTIAGSICFQRSGEEVGVSFLKCRLRRRYSLSFGCTKSSQNDPILQRL